MRTRNIVVLSAAPFVIVAAFLIATHQNKYEYRTDAIPDPAFEEVMNVLGQNGWETVSTRRALMDGFGAYEVILRRPIGIFGARSHADDQKILLMEADALQLLQKRRAEEEAAAQKAKDDAEKAETDALNARIADEAKERDAAIQTMTTPEKKPAATTMERGPDGKVRISNERH